MPPDQSRASITSITGRQQRHYTLRSPAVLKNDGESAGQLCAQGECNCKRHILTQGAILHICTCQIVPRSAERSRDAVAKVSPVTSNHAPSTPLLR